MAATMKCPHCQSDIDIRATRCPFCSGSIKTGDNSKFTTTILVVFVLITGICIFFTDYSWIDSLIVGVVGAVILGPVLWFYNRFIKKVKG